MHNDAAGFYAQTLQGWQYKLAESCRFIASTLTFLQKVQGIIDPGSKGGDHVPRKKQ